MKTHTSFLWGAVNIGAQTEGAAAQSSWARWGRAGRVPRIGRANDYWHRFAHHHDIATSMGCNALRITIEWARVEPHDGVFDDEAIAHYRAILHDLKKRNITTVVGLWHWDVPIWFDDTYGVHKKVGVAKYLRFAKKVRDELGALIDMVVVLNEPQVFVAESYVAGTRPPFHKNTFLAYRAKRNLVKMHRATYALWKEHYSRILVGSTFLWNDEYAAHNTMIQKTFVRMKEYLRVHAWIKSVRAYSDYIGINYYTRDGVFFGRSRGVWGRHGTNNWHDPDVWRGFPVGLYHVLLRARRYAMPLYVLENGKPTPQGLHDRDRQVFLTHMIAAMHKAMRRGADVRGYFHYSLCDSYEWNSGYDFRFGLVEVDRETCACTPRDSAHTYAQIIARNT